jgi:biopolymer transport protein ExbB/TolQ
MNLSEWIQRIMVGSGAQWVMYVMLGLSVISVAIILERAWFFWSLRDDLDVLAKELRTALDDSIETARKRMDASPSAEAAVVSAGLVMAHRGASAAEEAMAGALALQRMKLERRLAYLGTLGNNAPFIGLLGTVLGVIQAFHQLGDGANKGAMGNVMGGISEALVATGVGLVVALPAVVAFNVVQRRIGEIETGIAGLGKLITGFLKAQKVQSSTTSTTTNGASTRLNGSKSAALAAEG